MGDLILTSYKHMRTLPEALEVAEKFLAPLKADNPVALVVAAPPIKREAAGLAAALPIARETTILIYFKKGID